MDKNSFTCRICHKDIWEIVKRGAFLDRVSPKGEDFIGECRPSCYSTGNQEDAILRALGSASDIEHLIMARIGD